MYLAGEFCKWCNFWTFLQFGDSVFMLTMCRCVLWMFGKFHAYPSHNSGARCHEPWIFSSRVCARLNVRHCPVAVVISPAGHDLWPRSAHFWFTTFRICLGGEWRDDVALLMTLARFSSSAPVHNPRRCLHLFPKTKTRYRYGRLFSLFASFAAAHKTSFNCRPARVERIFKRYENQIWFILWLVA